MPHDGPREAGLLIPELGVLLALAVVGQSIFAVFEGENARLARGSRALVLEADNARLARGSRALVLEAENARLARVSRALTSSARPPAL